MDDQLGLYIHVPFCDGKCPYCDFYSLPADEARMDRYTDLLEDHLKSWAQRLDRPADTLYFGGGTPNLLGAERLNRLVSTAKDCFGLESGEITVEANPGRELGPLFESLRRGGVNRLSIGLQSASQDELGLLGRRHTVEQAREAVHEAQAAGFDNISLDLMLGIQGQSADSLRRSVEFCAESGATHVSAYLLKVEPGTAYYKKQDALVLPDEDETGGLYLLACQELERHGFLPYEISNFAVPGFESRHNLKYWHCEEYLGLGPAAHSFLNGRRFWWPRSLRDFEQGCEPTDDGPGGDFEEYAMLALRLTEGLREADCLHRFGYGIPQGLRRRAERFQSHGLVVCEEASIRFTTRGFLVSNALLAEILLDQ